MLAGNPSTYRRYDFLFKVVMLGDSSVGKSSILYRFCDEKFFVSNIPTIGIDMKIKFMDVENYRLKILLWDTGGQEKYRCIAKSYIKNTDGFVLTYSVTDRDSFQNVENWIKYIVQNSEKKEYNMVLIGNKTDLNNRVVSYDEGQELASSLNIPFIETSAFSNSNISEAFEIMAKNIVNRVGEDRNRGISIEVIHTKGKIFGCC